MGKYNYFDDEYEKDKAEIIREKVSEIKMSDYRFGKLKEWFENLSISDIIHPKSKEQKRVNVFISILLILLAFILIIVICGTLLESHNKEQTVFEKDAGKVCNQYIADYGECKYEQFDSDKKHEDFYKIMGLSFARQLDFNNDGNPELLVAYQTGSTYVVEVWGYYKKEFIALYSGKANTSKNAEDGAWITLQKSGENYLIGTSDVTNTADVTMLELKSNKFKSSGKVAYSVAKDSFASTRGKDISSEFETIHLSYIEKRDAFKLVNTVETTVDSFSANIKEEQVTSAKKEATQNEAYSAICQNYIDKYGEPKINTSDGYSNLTGLAVVKEIDFNADGKNELLVIYESEKSVATADSDGEYVSTKQPCYTMEVYAWDGSTANRVYENEGLCQYYDDYDYSGNKNLETFYMLQNKSSKMNICTIKTSMDATKYDTGKVTSSIKYFNGKTFKTSYSSKVFKNYGYATYEVNGENVYSDDFYSNGFKVPYFYTNEATADGEEFVQYFVKTKSINADKIKNVPDETKQTINSLKS